MEIEKIGIIGEGNIISGVAEKMGKTPVAVNDYPGFVMKLGANHPMGPLELADFIGLDICLAILEVFHAELGEKYMPSPLLRKMVAGGKLGRKSGEGFYEYR